MENEITILSENDKLALIYKAGASRIEAIIGRYADCVIVENTVPDNDPNANVFKFQHKSGRVYTLTQRVNKSHDNPNYYTVVWGLVTCSMHGVLFNLTNLRRHCWTDWLTDDTIPEKSQYHWFRFHGKRLYARDISMAVIVYDDGKISVEQQYKHDWFSECLMRDTRHLADRIQQKDLRADPNYISGTRKRKQMMEVVNSVMAIEGPAECVAKAFDSDIFKLIQTVDPADTLLYDEVDIAEVTVNVKAVLPAFEDRVAFSFKYKITVNTQDYTTKCNETQEISLYCISAKFEVAQMYKGTMPFTIVVDMTPNKEKYTISKWRDNQILRLGKISDAIRATGKSFVQEYADNLSSLNLITDAVKSVC